MEKGQIVLFTDGLFGISSPSNVAVVLDEYKQKKTRMVRLLTVEGKRSAARKHVRSQLGEVPKEDMEDESALMAAIEGRIRGKGGAGRGGKKAKGAQRGGKGGLSPQQIYQSLDVRALWKMTAEGDDAGKGEGPEAEGPKGIPDWYHPGGLSPEDLARLMWSGTDMGREHLSSLDKAVSEKEKGHGYFFRKESAGSVLFHPLKKQTANTALTEANSIRELRKCFIKQVEDEEGYVLTVPVSDELGEIPVGDNLLTLLETLKRRMKHFALHDQWDPSDGLAGTGLWSLGDEDLEGLMEDFARGLAGDHRLRIASACLEALISLGELSWEEAGRLLVTRGINVGEYRFSESFPTEVESQCGRLPDDVEQTDMGGREDLRGLETYTIDPPDARDFDDAVSIGEGEDGTVRLWVHIADVSHYVLPDSHLDEEARRRATSVYLPTGVLPMLPPKLSEDLCSLRSGTPRLAMTVRMDIEDGEVREASLIESIIQVDDNLSYNAVLDLIDEGKEPFARMAGLAREMSTARGRPELETAERRVRYGPDGNSITAELKRATLATSMIETFMVAANEAAARFLRDNSVPGIYRIHPLPARLDIERFNKAVEALGLDCPIMIDYDRFTAAGVDGEGSLGDEMGGEARAKSRKGKAEEAQLAGEDAILAMLKSGGKFSLIPGAPEKDEGSSAGEMNSDTDEAGPELDETSKGKGGAQTDGGRAGRPPLIPLDPDKIEHYSDAYAKTLRALNNEKDRVFRDVMNLLVLRTMPRALYTTMNIGHFGLKSPCYTHFTSPIRRYPDVLVHRAARALLRGEDPPHEEEQLDEMVERCNEQAEAADRFEYAMTDAAMAIWLSRDRQGREELRTGVVSSLAPSAMFITMERGVEGRIPLSKLAEGRPALDESETCVVMSTLENPDMAEKKLDGARFSDDGHAEAVLYTLGQRIRVTIHRIQIAEGRVELGILHQGEGGPSEEGLP